MAMTGAYKFSDGNRTAQQALGEAAQLSVTMLSQYSGPVLGLGFNAAMTLGSVLNGDAAGVVQFGGQLAMNALEIAALVNPCGLAAKGLAAYGATVTGSQLFEPGGFTLKNFLLTGYNLLALLGACFTGDMLLLCEGGKKRADAIREGDQLWSRDEHDPDGPLVLKRVLRRFERTAKIWHMRVAGRLLRTTVEHPFWVENRQSWLPVGELQIGDVVRTDAGELLPVEAIEDAGKWEKVYNWEIEDYHTYFVSASEDAPNVWAHNTAPCTSDDDGHFAEYTLLSRRRGLLAAGEEFSETGFALAPGEKLTFFEQALYGHTEGIIVSDLMEAGKLGPGKLPTIEGILPPCVNCQKIMRGISGIYQMKVLYRDAAFNQWAWMNGEIIANPF
jgi:hypothetical protein